MNNNDETGSHSKPEPCPDNNMALAIASTILTFFGCCIVGSAIGVISIVYASKVNSYWNNGFHEEARKYAQKAKIWGIIGIATPIIFWLTHFVSIAME